MAIATNIDDAWRLGGEYLAHNQIGEEEVTKVIRG